MIYLNAFIFCGLVCMIGQIILDNTSFTPGHLNTLFVILGSILTGFGLYDIFIDWAGTGATMPITNFGYLLTMGAYEGYKTGEISGLLSNIFSLSSAGIVVTILISFIVALVFKPKH